MCNIVDRYILISTIFSVSYLTYIIKQHYCFFNGIISYNLVNIYYLLKNIRMGVPFACINVLSTSYFCIKLLFIFLNIP